MYLRKCIKQFVVLFFILFVCVNTVIAKTDPFYNQKGFTVSDTFNMFSSRYQVSGIVNNPSILSFAEKFQFKMDYGQNNFDYKTMGLSTVIPFSHVVCGVGYYSYYSDDYYRVPQALTDERPSIQEYFRHSFDSFIFSLSPRIDSFLGYGFTIHYFKHSLDNDFVDVLGFDFGVRLSLFKKGWVGLYSQNGFLTNYRWDNSRFQELLSRHFVGEIGWEDTNFSASISYRNFEDLKLNGLYKLSDSLFLLGSMVNVYDVTKYKYGVELALQGVKLQYKRIQSFMSDYGFVEDIIGIMLDV